MKKFLGMKVLLALGAVAFSLGITTSSARADFTLDQLLTGTATGTQTVGGVTFTGTGSGIQVGDKLFDTFVYSTTGTGMPTAANVNVIGVVIGGNIGLEFSGGFGTGVGTISDAKLKFDVTVTDPNSVITDAHIAGNPDVSGGSGVFNVKETFANAPGSTKIFAADNGLPGGASDQLTDGVVFATPLTKLEVQKDIFASSGTGFPSMSILDQTFSQRTRHVPEPASFALVGLGLLGTGFAAYRRRKMTV